MARANQKQGVLRGCPTCGTKVDDADLGLRDFRWVNEALPGKVGGMDVDFLVQQRKSKTNRLPEDRFLALELKPKKAAISTGARLTFQGLQEKGFDVWAAWDQEDGEHVKWAPLEDGQLPGGLIRGTRAELAEAVRDWWDQGVPS